MSDKGSGRSDNAKAESGHSIAPVGKKKGHLKTHVDGHVKESGARVNGSVQREREPALVERRELTPAAIWLAGLHQGGEGHGAGKTAVQRSVEDQDSGNPSAQEIADKFMNEGEDAFTHLDDEKRLKHIDTVIKDGKPFKDMWGPHIRSEIIILLWKSERREQLASQNPELWKASVKKAPNLLDLDDFDTIKEAFLQDVHEMAKWFIFENETMVNKELTLMGADAEGFHIAPGETEQEKEEAQELRVAQMQEFADVLLKSRKGVDVIKKTIVGWDRKKDKPIYFDPLKEYPMEDWRGYSGNNWERTKIERARGTGKPVGNWADLKPEHDELAKLVQEITSRFPALYMMLENDPDKLTETNQSDPRQAKQLILDSLYETKEHIDYSKERINDKDVLMEMWPIHQQLMRGDRKESTTSPAGFILLPGPRSASGIDWSNPFYQSLANEYVEDYQDSKFWERFLLGTLAAAAFLIAEIATGGLATVALFVGAGATALEVGEIMQDFERADVFESLEQAEAADELQMAYPGQADAIRFGAMIDAVFAALDVFGIVKMASLGTKAAGVGLHAGQYARGASKLLDDASSALGRGEKKALKKEVSALKDQLLKGENLADVNQQLMKRINAGQEMAVLRELNMEWDDLVKHLGKDSEAMKALSKWRDALGEEMEQAFEGSVKRTGTIGEPGNDFDVNILDARATQMRDEVYSYLMGRTGMSLPQLQKNLDIFIFTDPRRLTLYDQLPRHMRSEIAVRQARKEQGIIWAQRYRQAKEAGDEALQKQILDEAEGLGITRAEIMKIKPPSKRVAKRMEKELDDLQVDFQKAMQKGDHKKAKELAEEISDRQAYINAAEDEAYKSGGGTSYYAVRRDPKMSHAAAGEMHAAQWYTAAIDQLPALDKAVKNLQRVIRELEQESMENMTEATVEKLAKAMKAVGKYGHRFPEMANLGMDAAKPASKALVKIEKIEFEMRYLMARAKFYTSDEITKNLAKLKGDANRSIRALQDVSWKTVKAMQDSSGVLGVSASFLQVQRRLKIHNTFMMMSEHVLSTLNIIDLAQGSFGRDDDYDGSLFGPAGDEEDGLEGAIRPGQFVLYGSEEEMAALDEMMAGWLPPEGEEEPAEQ